MRPLAEALGLDVDARGRGGRRGRDRQHVRRVQQRAGAPRPRPARLQPWSPSAAPARSRPASWPQEFHIPRVIVPPSPGTLCAQGAHERRRQERLRQDAPPAAVRRPSGKLLAARVRGARRARAQRWLAEEAPRRRRRARSPSAPTSATWARPSRSRCRSTRLARGRRTPTACATPSTTVHDRLYAHADRAADVELIDLRATITGATPKPRLKAAGTRTRPGDPFRADGRSTTGSSATRPRSLPPARPPGRPAPGWAGRRRAGRHDHAGAGRLPGLGGRRFGNLVIEGR